MPCDICPIQTGSTVTLSPLVWQCLVCGQLRPGIQIQAVYKGLTFDGSWTHLFSACEGAIVCPFCGDAGTEFHLSCLGDGEEAVVQEEIRIQGNTV